MRSQQTLILIALSVLGHVGCGAKPEPQPETVRGLQESNLALQEQVRQLKEDLTAVRQQRDVDLTHAGRDADDRTARLRQGYEERLKAAEAESAHLKLELGAVRRERLVLQETVEKRPRLDEAAREGLWLERVVWLALLMTVIVLLVIVVSLYRNLRVLVKTFVLAKARYVSLGEKPE